MKFFVHPFGVRGEVRFQFGRYRLLLVFLGFLFFVNLACSEQSEKLSVHFVNPDGSKSPAILAETANTDAARSLGLMYRREIGELEGMFFVFPDSQERSFWMKNTYIELDIIFLDDDFRVVSIINRAAPHTVSERKSQSPATYVLEIPGGSAEKWKIVVDSKLQVRGEVPKAR